MVSITVTDGKKKKKKAITSGSAETVSRKGKKFLVPAKEARQLEKQGKETDKSRLEAEAKTKDIANRRRLNELNLAGAERDEAVRVKSIESAEEVANIESKDRGDEGSFPAEVPENFTADTRFGEVKDVMTRQEFAEQKRKIFEEENPSQSRFLKAAASTTALAAGGQVAGALVAASRAKTLSQVLKGSTNKQILSKGKLIKTFGLSEKQAVSAISKFNSMKATEVVSKLSGKTSLLTKGNLAKGAGLAATFAGTDTIFTWYALDNVASGLKFMIPDARESLELGTRTPEEVAELFEEAEVTFQLALAKVDQTARFNPFTYPAKKLIVAGANADFNEFQLAKDNFLAGG